MRLTGAQAVSLAYSAGQREDKGGGGHKSLGSDAPIESSQVSNLEGTGTPRGRKRAGSLGSTSKLLSYAQMHALGIPRIIGSQSDPFDSPRARATTDDASSNLHQGKQTKSKLLQSSSDISMVSLNKKSLQQASPPTPRALPAPAAAAIKSTKPSPRPLDEPEPSPDAALRAALRAGANHSKPEVGLSSMPTVHGPKVAKAADASKAGKGQDGSKPGKAAPHIVAKLPASVIANTAEDHPVSIPNRSPLLAPGDHPASSDRPRSPNSSLESVKNAQSSLQAQGPMALPEVQRVLGANSDLAYEVHPGPHPLLGRQASLERRTSLQTRMPSRLRNSSSSFASSHPGDEVVAAQPDEGNKKSQQVSPVRRISIELMKRTHSSPDVGVLAYESRTERLFNQHRRLEEAHSPVWSETAGRSLSLDDMGPLPRTKSRTSRTSLSPSLKSIPSQKAVDFKDQKQDRKQRGQSLAGLDEEPRLSGSGSRFLGLFACCFAPRGSEKIERAQVSGTKGKMSQVVTDLFSRDNSVVASGIPAVQAPASAEALLKSVQLLSATSGTSRSLRIMSTSSLSLHRDEGAETLVRYSAHVLHAVTDVAPSDASFAEPPLVKISETKNKAREQSTEQRTPKRAPSADRTPVLTEPRYALVRPKTTLDSYGSGKSYGKSYQAAESSRAKVSEKPLATQAVDKPQGAVSKPTLMEGAIPLTEKAAKVQVKQDAEQNAPGKQNESSGHGSEKALALQGLQHQAVAKLPDAASKSSAKGSKAPLKNPAIEGRSAASGAFKEADPLFLPASTDDVGVSVAARPEQLPGNSKAGLQLYKSLASAPSATEVLMQELQELEQLAQTFSSKAITKKIKQERLTRQRPKTAPGQNVRGSSAFALPSKPAKGQPDKPLRSQSQQQEVDRGRAFAMKAEAAADDAGALPPERIPKPVWQRSAWKPKLPERAPKAPKASSPGRVVKPGVKSRHPKQSRVAKALLGQAPKHSNALPPGGTDEELGSTIPGSVLASIFSLSSEVSMPASEGIDHVERTPGPPVLLTQTSTFSVARSLSLELWDAKENPRPTTTPEDTSSASSFRAQEEPPNMPSATMSWGQWATQDDSSQQQVSARVMDKRPTMPLLQWNTGSAHAPPDSSAASEARYREELGLDVPERMRSEASGLAQGSVFAGHPDDKADVPSAEIDAQAELFSGLKGLVEAMMKASAAADRATGAPQAAAQPMMDL